MTINREEAIKHLNELFAEELEAGLRYLCLASSLKGLDRLLVRDTMLENMNETLEHAQAIANRILQLGSVPQLELKLSIPPERTNAQEAIRTALAFEQAALDSYRELLEKLEGSDDIALEEFVREQVAVESQHVSELYTLLEN